MKIYRNLKNENERVIYIFSFPVYKCIYFDDGYIKYVMSLIEKKKTSNGIIINICGFKVININKKNNEFGSVDEHINENLNIDICKYVSLDIEKDDQSEFEEKEYNIKQKLYLHIGSAKTGSTALQNFLATHIIDLYDHNIIYPQIFKNEPILDFGGNAYSFAKMLIEDNTNINMVKNIASKMAQVSFSLKKDMLISCEMFGDEMPEDKVAILFNIFKKYFKIECIIYVRDPLSWYFSRWKQDIKAIKEIRSIKKYILEHNNQIPYINIWIKYSDNIHIIPYEKNKKDIYSPVLKIINAEIKDRPETFTNINRTLTDFELLTFLTLNNNDAITQDLIWQVYGLVWTQDKSAISRPDPVLAPLADQRHEEFFQAISPYISREEIIVEHSPLTARDMRFYEDLETFLSILERYKED